MSDTIKVESLAPGDVLLYKGTSFISRAIQFFDGTDFSHAALYLGEGIVGEAVAEGLVRRPYEEGAHGIWVQAHRLKEDVTMQPVLDVAAAYLDQGNRYGYEQLLLLAFLCLTRKLRFTPSLRQLIRRVLDDAAAVLTRLISESREPTICSEFVYRAFDEALPAPNDVYTLWINPLALPAATGFAPPMPETAVAARPPVRGQGIHPQSLLALYASSAGSAWVGGARPGPAFAAPPPLGTDAASLEALVDTYLDEVQAGAGALPPSFHAPAEGLEDLLGATQRFAAELHRATHPAEAEFAAEGVPGMPATLGRTLSLAAADFVTPGDLYKSQSLFLLGKVEE